MHDAVLFKCYEICYNSVIEKKATDLKNKQEKNELYRKMSEYRSRGFLVPNKKLIKTQSQIEAIKKSAAINVAALDYVAEHIREGMSTNEIDMLVYKKTTDLGGIPAPLGYEGFPKSCCTSINSAVCHGIPSDQIVLKEGDIINVDVSTIYQGFYSDSSRMFCIGKVSEERKKLVDVTRQCVSLGLKEVKPWTPIGNVGAAVHEYAKANGYSVVKEVGGHGCGIEFHEDPWVGFTTSRNTGMLMVPGMIFTIEPMVNAGRSEIYIDSSNDWTIYTMDGKDSAQWEIQVLVTDEGAEIIAY